MKHKINDDIKHLVQHVARTNKTTCCDEMADLLYYTLTDVEMKYFRLRKKGNMTLRRLINKCRHSAIYICLVDKQECRMIYHSFVIETRKIEGKTQYKVYNAWYDNYCLEDWMINSDGKINPETFRNFGAFRYRDLDAKSNFIDKLEEFIEHYTPELSEELFNVDVGNPVDIMFHQSAIKGFYC